MTVVGEQLSVIGVSENYLLLITGYRSLITNSYRLSFDIFWKLVTCLPTGRLEICHCFTAPLVSPWTMRLWKNTAIRITGTEETAEAAIIYPQGSSP